MRGLLVTCALLFSTGAHAAWEYELVEDPMSDAKRGISSLSDQTGKAMIVIKCDRNGTNSLYMSMISSEYLGGAVSRDRYRTIDYRFDDGPVQSLNAVYDGRVASVLSFAPKTRESDFLKAFERSGKVAIRVTSYDYKSYTYVFNLAGSLGAVEKSARACGDTNWYQAPVGQGD